MGSAPAPGAVFRALAENPDALKSCKRPGLRHAQPPAARAPPATPEAGVLPNCGVRIEWVMRPARLLVFLAVQRGHDSVRAVRQVVRPVCRLVRGCRGPVQPVRRLVQGVFRSVQGCRRVVQPVRRPVQMIRPLVPAILGLVPAIRQFAPHYQAVATMLPVPPAVFGGIEASGFGGGLGGPGGTAEISRGQDRLGGRRPRYCGRKHRGLGFRRPAGAGSTRDLVSGGGAGGLPPANFLGAFSASPNPLARPSNSTENSGLPPLPRRNQPLSGASKCAGQPFATGATSNL